MLEWLENPVTEFLKSCIASYAEDLGKANKRVYCFAEPFKTQDAMAQLVGQEAAWGEISSVLEGDWMVFSEGERDEEYFRYLSEGE